MRIPVFLALTLPLLIAVPARAQEKSKSKFPILVVNMRRIIDETDEGKEFVARLNQEMAAEKQRLSDEAMKLQEEVKRLREAKIGDRTPEYYKELEKAMETQARLEMDKNLFLAKKGDELSRATHQLLLGAQQEARTVMRERGAEIVLLTKTGPFEVASDQDFQQELVMRRVLCCSDEVDVTDEVIRRMNEWYRENKRAERPPPRKSEGAAKPAEAPAKE